MFYNIIVIVIKLYAFFGLNCNCCPIMNGMENVKLFCPSVTTVEQLNVSCLNLILEKTFQFSLKWISKKENFT